MKMWLGLQYCNEFQSAMAEAKGSMETLKMDRAPVLPHLGYEKRTTYLVVLFSFVSGSIFKDRGLAIGKTAGSFFTISPTLIPFCFSKKGIFTLWADTA